MTKLPIDQITVAPNRMRKDLGDINSLMESIQEYGLMHPIVVYDRGDSYLLLAGERRLTAAQRAGWTEIPVTIFEDLNGVAVKAMELEENIKRQNLSISERARGVKELEELKQIIYGKKKVGVNVDSLNYSEGFGRRDTAKLLDRSVGSVTQDIQIAEAIDFFPDLADLTSKSQILREYKRRKEEIVLRALAEIDAEERGVSAIEDTYIHADCLEWMAKQPDESFDLAIADPPWGIKIEDSLRSHMGGRAGKDYDDQEKSAFELMNAMIPELFRLLRNDRHLYFFFGIQYYETVRHLLTIAGFEVDPVPIIWKKTHFTGPPTGNRWPGQWECMFFCQKGNRKLSLTSGGNVLDAAIVPPSKRVHVSQKPVELFLPIIKASTIENELVLDPTAGSGAVHRASYQLNRRCYALEKDQDIYLRAKEALKGEIPTLIAEPEEDEYEGICALCGESGATVLASIPGSAAYPVHEECADTYEDLLRKEQGDEDA